MEKWSEKIANCTLIITALISILVGIGDIFFDFQEIKYLKETSQITLLVVGILAFSLGIERSISFGKLSKKINQVDTGLAENQSTLDELKKLFKGNISTQFIDESLEILEAAADLVSRAEERVYILNFDLQSFRLGIQSGELEKQAFRNYFGELINAIGRSQNFDFRMVYSYPEQISEEDLVFIENQIKECQNAGILSRCQFATKQIPLGFSLLLIDDKHLIMGFPMRPQDPRPSNAVKLTNNQTLVNRLAKWFDLCVWSEADAVHVKK